MSAPGRELNRLAGEQAPGSWSLQQHLMGHVRPLEERDIPQIVRLYAAIYGDRQQRGPEAARARLQRIFFRHPWYDERYPSLVYQDNDGRIVGCIGVLPRPMSLDGRRLTAAISHSFMVEPGSRSSLAALHLARRFLTGTQDLSLAEGSDASRRIWEGMGGSTSLLYSLCWTRPLRPSRYVLSFLKRRGLSAPLAWVLRPLCRMFDAAAPLIQHRPFRLPQPGGSVDEFEDGELSDLIYRFTADRPLKPDYSAAPARWLLETLREVPDRGPLERGLVRDRHGQVLGWYIYYLKPDGMAEVVQVGANAATAGAVLDHLFHQAKRRGAICVTGQVDPALFKSLCDKSCVFHHDGNSWMLIHSRHPEVMQAIYSGRTFLTRLEGEWWISATLGQQ